MDSNKGKGNKGCHIIDHPVVQHKLSILRDKNTEPRTFRHIMEELSALLAYEVSSDLKLKEVEIETPLSTTKGNKIDEDVILVTILRAGNGMLNGIVNLLSFASVGHIGIYRDKFIHNTVEYYFRLPNDCEGKRVLLLDPLLATGDTAVAAISRLKQYRVGPIKLVTILAATPGINNIKKWHPDVDIFTASVEPELNDVGYILPGLGDAGDRLYGTEAEL